MTSDNIPSIDEKTLYKLIEKKTRMGFENKSWDEWFEHILDIHNDDKENKIENYMKSYFYENLYEKSIKNFSINLQNVWNERSANDVLDDISFENRPNSAIVIGRGPSLKKHGHLQLLSKSNYKGAIICSDGILSTALENGVTPDRFPNFFVITVDADKIIKEYYDHEKINEYGPKIKGLFSTVTDPDTVNEARRRKIGIHWFHSLFDLDEGEKSFNKISALMVRSKKHKKGLPGLQTGGNVGTTCWFAAWRILKCNTACLIGIDHSWTENDSLDVITTHGKPKHKFEINYNEDDFNKLFPKIYNPFFDCTCILDPIFQYYSNGLKEFIARSPTNFQTINATEGGCIFGDRINCMKFNEFLLKNDS
jgi:hypothetical protein